MPTLGADCQIILTHATVNGGQGTGFMLADGTAAAAQRSALELTLGTYTEITKLFASIVLADGLRLPNGARDPRTRAQLYAALMAYLQQRAGLSVETPVGVYTGLYCTNHLATESHYPGYSVVVCTFTSLNAAFVPSDPAAYAFSGWHDEAAPPSATVRTWSNSVWRTV